MCLVANMETAHRQRQQHDQDEQGTAPAAGRMRQQGGCRDQGRQQQQRRLLQRSQRREQDDGAAPGHGNHHARDRAWRRGHRLAPQQQHGAPAQIGQQQGGQPAVQAQGQHRIAQQPRQQQACQAAAEQHHGGMPRTAVGQRRCSRVRYRYILYHPSSPVPIRQHRTSASTIRRHVAVPHGQRQHITQRHRGTDDIALGIVHLQPAQGIEDGIALGKFGDGLEAHHMADLID